jgi:hypothetical protein
MRQTKRLWTTSKDQAIRFLKTSIAKAFANGSIKENQDYGYLSIFQLRPSPELSTYAFDDANVEWLHCVAAHRKRLLFLDVEDTMAKYDIKKDFSVTLNANNIFDEEYVLNTVGSQTWGAERNYTLSLNYKF